MLGRPKFRVIHGLRFVNEYLQEVKFQRQSLKRCEPLLKSGWFMTAADLESGYSHLSVKEGDRTFLGFKHRGVYYEMCTLPFGLSSAPEAFTRLTKTMVRRWRSRGWIVRHCLDDVGFLAETKEGAEAMIRQAFADVRELGFGCNLAKCETVGSNFMRFLGLIVDLRQGSGSPSSARRSW